MAALDQSSEVLLLAPARGAVDDLLREACAAGSGLFGVHRTTPSQLAAELATPRLADAGLGPVSGLGIEALAARAISLCLAGGELSYFEPVADSPGMARALANTLRELRAHGVTCDALASTGPPGKDLARLLERYEHELVDASLADPTVLLELARAELESGEHMLIGLPVLMLDLAAAPIVERRFSSELVRRAPSVFATLVQGDDEARRSLEEVVDVEAQDITAQDLEDSERLATSRLDRLRRRIFSQLTDAESSDSRDGAPAKSKPHKLLPAASDFSFTFLSAAGEGRESVEIARRIQALAQPLHEDDADSGLGFDRIAILLRDPNAYLPLVEEALRRAGIPAYFSRGTRRPDPSGRAVLALLDCAAEGLSASRFAEYLSLGQVPELDEAGAPAEVEVPWVAPEGDQLVFKTLLAPEEPATSSPGSATSGDSANGATPDDEAPAIGGTLRIPRGWERLLVDARVYGGIERWRERLAGLQAELRLQLRGLSGEESAREGHLKSQLERLAHLEHFALPVVETLAELPRSELWGTWLEALEDLATLVLRQPERVLTVLAELRPMDRVGPVALDEVRRVLGDRLGALRLEPPTRRYGRVFVGTIEEARGRSFEAVFLPGLAEGIFPRRALEDPLLLDLYRRRLAAPLPTQTERIVGERLLLRIAAGAARSRLIVSYPNLDVLQGRTRVPSFYALDLLRAAEGEIPDLRQLEARAAAGSESLLGWPAPRDPSTAIDSAEYDLSVLEPLLRDETLVANGKGRFLLDANEHLTRSLRSRWRRWRPAVTAADGVVDPDPETLAGLTNYRLAQRSYSPTALQRYAACPYRFLLYSIHGLRPREDAVRLEQIDPLTRGSLFHQIQFELFQELQQKGLLSFEESTEHAINTALDEIVQRVAGQYYEDLAPAIDRIWSTGIEELHTDLRGWIRSRIADDESWLPSRFEMAFGLAGNTVDTVAADLRLADEPLGAASVAGGKLLRGAIDLVEASPDGAVLRVTDHKTGKSPERKKLIVGGGKALQPVLYALAAEQLLGVPVDSGRLAFCTRRGRYTTQDVALDDDARRSAGDVLGEIDRAVERGFFPAAPDEGECKWCDYRQVCGPNVEARVRRKHPHKLIPLSRLREMP
ncbi:MAG: PD-(D/E)XK nuclease family protein [Acidobacteriota bacterium]